MGGVELLMFFRRLVGSSCECLSSSVPFRTSQRRRALVELAGADLSCRLSYMPAAVRSFGVSSFDLSRESVPIQF